MQVKLSYIELLWAIVAVVVRALIPRAVDVPIVVALLDIVANKPLVRILLRHSLKLFKLGFCFLSLLTLLFDVFDEHLRSQFFEFPVQFQYFAFCLRRYIFITLKDIHRLRLLDHIFKSYLISE